MNTKNIRQNINELPNFKKTYDGLLQEARQKGIKPYQIAEVSGISSVHVGRDLVTPIYVLGVIPGSLLFAPRIERQTGLARDVCEVGLDTITVYSVLKTF